MSAREGYTANANARPGGPTPGLDLQDQGLFYNTTGEAAEYWSQFKLPKLSKDIRQLRADLHEWGYCLVHDALSAEQVARLRRRVEDQAAGERAAGLAMWIGSDPLPGQRICGSQHLTSLYNKGEQLRQLVESNPEGVQGGPVIEQLITECVGPGYIIDSFVAIIQNKNCLPQTMHQDQSGTPLQTEAPLMCNQLYVLDDMGPENGGTLVVPGSHRLLSAAGSARPLETPLPPAINLAAPAGTVVVFEGRLLHGAGVNKTNRPRVTLAMSCNKPWIRQQDLAVVSALPEIVAAGSRKLLQRLGFQSLGKGGIEGRNWHGDWAGHQRHLIDRGQFVRVGELSPDSPKEVLLSDYSTRHTPSARAMAEKNFASPEIDPNVKAAYEIENVEGLWSAPKKTRTGTLTSKL